MQFFYLYFFVQIYAAFSLQHFIGGPEMNIWFQKIGVYVVTIHRHTHDLEKSEILVGNKIRLWNIQNYMLSAS